MGEQLVEGMSATWKPEEFTDLFRDQILKLVATKVEAGDTAAVTVLETDRPAGAGATVYELAELLRRSLDKNGGKAEKTPTTKAAKASFVTDKAAGPAKTPAAKSAVKPSVKSAVKPTAKRKAA